MTLAFWPINQRKLAPQRLGAMGGMPDVAVGQCYAVAWWLAAYPDRAACRHARVTSPLSGKHRHA